MTASGHETQPCAWDAIKCAQLHTQLCKYKDSLCKEATDSKGGTIPLLFGVELTTGLTDYLLGKIVKQCHTIHSVPQ